MIGMGRSEGTISIGIGVTAECVVDHYSDRSWLSRQRQFQLLSSNIALLGLQHARRHTCRGRSGDDQDRSLTLISSAGIKHSAMVSGLRAMEPSTVAADRPDQ